MSQTIDPRVLYYEALIETGALGRWIAKIDSQILEHCQELRSVRVSSSPFGLMTYQ